MIGRAAILVAMVLGWLPAAAGEGDRLTGDLSLDAAIATAIEKNLDLRAAYQQREIARGRRLEAWSEALPTLELNGSYTRQGSAPGIEDDAGSFVAFGVRDTSYADLLLIQPLWQGGRGAAALRASKVYKAYTEEELRQAVQDVVFRVSLAYWTAVYGQQEYRVALNALQLAQTHLKDVETKKRFGVASSFNVLRSEVEVSNATAASITYKNRVHLAMTELFRAMGVSQDSDVTLIEKLVFQPAAGSESDALGTALARRPDITMADYAAKLQTEAVAVAKSEFYPRFELFAAETYQKPDPVVINQDDWGDNWRVGITMSLPIFDGLERKGRLVQEKARLNQRTIEAEDARERTRANVRSAIATIEDAAEAVASLEKTVEQAGEGLRLAEVGYREGTLDQVAVIDARGALTASRLNYEQGIYRHILAKIELERVSGTLGTAYQPGPPPSGSGR